MGDLFQLLEYWHWLLLAVLLIIFEVFAPGIFFLWMGLAAGIVGLVTWFMPDLIWEWQIIGFAVLSVLTAVTGRAWLVKNPIKTDQPQLNRRGEQYVGRVFTLDEAIVNGSGKIRVDDSTWKIEGSDCAAGTKVKVTGVDGVVLLVECLD